jgi:hypothetical protein
VPVGTLAFLLTRRAKPPSLASHDMTAVNAGVCFAFRLGIARESVLR